MASILSLFGTILIDNTAANKSIDTTTEKAEKSGSKVGSAFSSIAKGAAAVGTAVVAGATAVGTAAFKMASDTSAAADNVDKMSQKIGISRTAYQEWDYLMSQNGMSVDKLQTGIKTLTAKWTRQKAAPPRQPRLSTSSAYRLQTRTAPCARKRRFSRKQ